MRRLFGLKVMTLMLLFAVVSSACRSGSSSAVGSKASPFKPSGDARKDLGDSLRKLSTAFPYRLTETTTTSATAQSGPDETTRVVEFAAAYRFHVKLSGGQGDELELITIGEKSYSKLDGKWNEEATSNAQKKKVDIEKNLADAIKDVAYVGPETVNGVDCFVYSYTIQMDSYAGKGKTWVRASDGLPLQSDSEFKYANVESKSHVNYEYNEHVKVEAPM